MGIPDMSSDSFESEEVDNGTAVYSSVWCGECGVCVLVPFHRYLPKLEIIQPVQ